MKHFPVSLVLSMMLMTFGCGQQEELEEPDYDNMVMADEEDEWTTGQELTGQELDGKVIAGERPEAQEDLILEILGDEKERSFEELR